MAEETAQHDADRTSRIAARCKRVQERLAAARQGDSTGAQEVAQQQEMPRTVQQLLDSSKRLIQLKQDTQQDVTAVRVQGDEQESMRRQRDERMRQELRGKLLAEAEAAAAANAGISSRWAGVLDLSVPQDMFNAIEQQRLACEAVIASKDRLIADIRLALKAKDEEYVKLLKRQAADVDTMLAAMGQQLAQLTAAYREELENVERVLMQERAELMASNRKEVAALLETRATAEAAFTDRYLAAVASYAQGLEDMRHADAEEYQVLKIKLECDIAVLEQHLETMRATYQLNAEKLEYNYRVLLERDAENTATINQQKRKLSRQHDVLLGLRNKYGRGDARACDENGRLTEEYKRITEHFQDMQAKFCHFGRVDAAKYAQLWRLQQAEACDLARQLLAADRVIHEQQLGWQWQPPDESLFASPHDAAPVADSKDGRAAAAAAATAATAAAGSTSEGGAGSQRSSGGGGGSLGSLGSQRSSSAGAAAGADGAAAARRASSGSTCSQGGAAGPQLPGSTAEVRQRLRAPAYFGALCLLVDEAGFLVEPRAAQLLAELPASEARLVAADSVVRALGVTDGPGFDALLDALSADGGAGRAAGAPPALVHPNDALVRLRLFVEAEAGISSSGGGGQQPAGAAHLAGSGAGADGAPAPAAAAARGGGQLPGLVGPAPPVSRRAAKREREYWGRLTQAVSDRALRVWARLEEQLGSYHRLLVARGQGLSAVAALRAENEELRGLLNQYLGSKINAELQVPPLAVL